MPLIERLANMIRWMSGVWAALRRGRADMPDRHRLVVGSVPVRIKAKELSITIGADAGQAAQKDAMR